MYTDIKSFEDACKALNISSVLPDVSMLPQEEQKAITAHYQLVIIAKALNGDWKPNWNNYDEYKYYPWFDMETYNDGRENDGFSFCDCGFSCAASHVGSRLCFSSSKIAKYAGQTFLPLYKDYFVKN